MTSWQRWQYHESKKEQEEREKWERRAEALREKVKTYQTLGKGKITYEVIEEVVRLNKSTTSKLLRGSEQLLRQPSARTNLVKIIKVFVMKKAIRSRPEAEEFLQTLFPEDRLSEENEGDQEVIALLSEQEQANHPQPLVAQNNQVSVKEVAV